MSASQDSQPSVILTLTVWTAQAHMHVGAGRVTKGMALRANVSCCYLVLATTVLPLLLVDRLAKCERMKNKWQVQAVCLNCSWQWTNGISWNVLLCGTYIHIIFFYYSGREAPSLKMGLVCFYRRRFWGLLILHFGRWLVRGLMTCSLLCHAPFYAVFTRDTFTWGKGIFTIENVTQCLIWTWSSIIIRTNQYSK